VLGGYYDSIYFPSLTGDLLTWDGQVVPDSMFPDLDPECVTDPEDTEADYTQLCDGGCSGAHYVGTLRRGQSFSIESILQVGVVGPPFNRGHLCRSFSWGGDGFQATAVTAFTGFSQIPINNPGFPVTDENADFLDILYAGYCPCFINSTCVYSDIGTVFFDNCVCDEFHYGDFCQHKCINGLANGASCKCYEGFYGQNCENTCNCARGSLCDSASASGDCYCKNGFHGDECNKLNSCPKGQQ